MVSSEDELPFVRGRKISFTTKFLPRSDSYDMPESSEEEMPPTKAKSAKGKSTSKKTAQNAHGCKICGEALSRDDQLLKHVKRYHGKNAATMTIYGAERQVILVNNKPWIVDGYFVPTNGMK